MEKPDVDAIDGIAPAIAIRQKNSIRNPRSTVGTTTEIHDYLRLLWARVGHTICRQCGKPVERESPDVVADALLGAAGGHAAADRFRLSDRASCAWPPMRAADAATRTATTKPARRRGRLPLEPRGGRRRAAGAARRADPLPATLDALRRRGFGRLLVSRPHDDARRGAGGVGRARRTRRRSP